MYVARLLVEYLALDGTDEGRKSTVSIDEGNLHTGIVDCGLFVLVGHSKDKS